jgi:WD40 repeat protein
MAWSPDDTMIVTVGNVQAANKRNLALLWNTDSGNLKHQLPIFKEPVTSVVWAPDGQSFLTGCLEKTQSLCQWNLDGELIYDWRQAELRIGDLAISPNGRWLVVAIGGKKNFLVYNFITREFEYESEMDDNIASIAIGQISNELLVNKTNGETRIIDLETHKTVHTYRSGVQGGQFVVRASYGGANESFVVVGSEGSCPHKNSIKQY